MLDPELRRNVRLRLMDSIAEIADVEEQKSNWLLPDQSNLHFSYIQYSNCYFDVVDIGSDTTDIWEPLKEMVSKGFLSERERVIISDFHELISNHQSPTGDDWDNEAVLNDPRWLAVCKAAEKAQIALLQLPLDDEERRRLSGK